MNRTVVCEKGMDNGVSGHKVVSKDGAGPSLSARDFAILVHVCSGSLSDMVFLDPRGREVKRRKKKRCTRSIVFAEVGSY